MRISPAPPIWPALLIWWLCTSALFVLDGWWNLGNLALLLILGGTLASFWLSSTASLLVCALAVTGFNWFFVPPRHTFHVQLDQDLLLLITLLGTSTVISVLTSRLRQHAQQQTEQAQQAEHLHQLGTQLRHANTVSRQIQLAEQLLHEWTGLPAKVWLESQSPEPDDPLYRVWLASQQEQGAIGPGTGRHEALTSFALPLRAGVQRVGTLALNSGPTRGNWTLEHLQALTRLLADEIQRLQNSLQARQAQAKLQHQKLSNTLLAAISHDYRTPLATITSAASGLLESAPAPQIQQTVSIILQEAEHLHRMTTNTLHMAQLDTDESPMQCSWESVEELFGVALAAVRRRHSDRQVHTDMPSGLPFLWCNPVLLVQMLDNLLENALRYSPAQAAVTLQALTRENAIQLRVLDRGIGIPPEWHERVFDPFLRVLPQPRGDAGFAQATRRGMGLGLALCQAVARAHQAHLWIEDRPGGGTAVCVQFAMQAQPPLAAEVQASEGPA